MEQKGDLVYISRYEIFKAFFQTEVEENIIMLERLNNMINQFCIAEFEKRRNIISLPFNIKDYKDEIVYISEVIK